MSDGAAGRPNVSRRSGRRPALLRLSAEKKATGDAGEVEPTGEGGGLGGEGGGPKKRGRPKKEKTLEEQEVPPLSVDDGAEITAETDAETEAETDAEIDAETEPSPEPSTEPSTEPSLIIDAEAASLQSTLTSTPDAALSETNLPALSSARAKLTGLRTGPTFDVHSVITKFYEALERSNCTEVMTFYLPDESSLSVTYPNVKGTVRGWKDVKKVRGTVGGGGGGGDWRSEIGGARLEERLEREREAREAGH